MQYRFLIVDVFAERPFAGNQLAVLLDADALSETTMQLIAREFNFAETTFVQRPTAASSTCRVRIFTPRKELPFAGHPTIGTAAALRHIGRIRGDSAVFEEGVGPIPVTFSGNATYLSVDKPIDRPSQTPPSPAAALSLDPSAVKEAWYASAGVPFVFIRLASAALVDQAKLDLNAWQQTFSSAWTPHLYLFHEGDEVYARMFAPSLGIEEDPATGSAAVALAASLAARMPDRTGTFAWRISQGVAMGRPSRLEAMAEKRNGSVALARVGGHTVIVAEGTITV